MRHAAGATSCTESGPACLRNMWQLGTVRNNMRPESARAAAASAAESVETNPVAPCPLDVERLCRNKEQDAFEKEHNIAPGCGYYRRRYEMFLEDYPSETPPDYFLDYGEKYCNKFSRETYHKLSPRGKKWLEDTKCALQQKIEAELSDPKNRTTVMTSEKLAELAFETHPDAYIESGLFDLSIKELGIIALTAKEEFYPRAKYFDLTIDQALTVGRRYGEHIVEKSEEFVEDVIIDVVKSAYKCKEYVKDKIIMMEKSVEDFIKSIFGSEKL